MFDLSSCELSHSHSLTEIVKSHGMEFFAGFSYCVLAHAIAAAVLKSDVKVASYVGASTSIAFTAISIIDHRYHENDNSAHGLMAGIARMAGIVFLNTLVIKHFATHGRPISIAWSVVPICTLLLSKNIESILNILTSEE